MAYTYEQIFAADPSNPSNVAQNASITIFAPGDGTMTPLTITDPDGQPLANPIPVNANGFGSAFAHATLDRVAWAGGGFTGFFTSYEGMKQVALDAQAAAEEIITRADAGEFVGDPGPQGPAGMNGANVLPTAEAIKQAVEDPTNVARTAVDEAIRESPLNEVHAPAVISLIGGQPDETLTVTGCTISADTVNKRFGVQSWKLTLAGAVTATAKLPALTGGGAINEPISGVGVMIYVPDATKITGLTVQLYTGVADTNYYNFNITALRGGIAANLKTGWNIIRWTPSHKTITGTPLPFGNVDHARIVIVSNAATDVSVQQVFIQRRPKASMLFIHDGGYTLFDQSPGYFDLRERKVPVTWSVDTGLIGDANHVTDARLREIGAENRNSIGFHGWDGSDTTVMTAAQLQAHTMKAIKWLAVRGYTGRIWRSAWLQNSAPLAESTNDMVLVNPMFGTEGQERIQSWPFHDRYGVSRIAIQGKNEAQIDAIFTELKENHGVAVLYTHRVRDGFVADITPAMWTYFLAKYDQGVAEGWLEAVTLEMLLESSGVKIRQGMGGAWAAEWPNVDGTVTLKQLP